MTVTVVFTHTQKSLLKLASILILLSFTLTPLLAPFASSAKAIARAAAPATEDPVNFAVIGDFGGDRPSEGLVANLVDSWNPDLIITTGDNRYGDRTFDQVVGQYYCDYLADVVAGEHCAGGNAATNAFFPSLGNHDHTDGGNLGEYVGYFSLPGSDIASSGTSGNERYYDFVKGPLHFFAIDSYSALLDSADMTAQQDWLQAQLATSTSRWQIVYFHHPPYSSGAFHGSRTEMQWPFAEWGADAVINGHDHAYERLDVNGLPYFVNGAGGHSLYDFGTPLPESVVRYKEGYGAMLVTATDEQISFQFRAINGDGLVDTFTMPETSFTADPARCYAIANDDNRLVAVNRDTGGDFSVAGTMAVNDIEAIAWSKSANTLYAADGGLFGRINESSGLFAPIGSGLGSGAGIETPSGNGYDGAVNFDRISGLTTDPVTDVLYGVARNAEDANAHDVLFKIDPTTGDQINNAFGSDKDFVSIDTGAIDGAPSDVGDIAIDPADRAMYAIANNSSGDRLIKVNKATGSATDIGLLRDIDGDVVTNVEGLSFHNDSTLYASTGNNVAVTGDRLWTVDKTTGVMSELDQFAAYTNYEALACLTAGTNTITGVAFEDVDISGEWDRYADRAASGATVILYRDQNENGLLEYDTDTVVDATITKLNGVYRFDLAIAGYFVVAVDTGTLASQTLSTPDTYAVHLSDFGNLTDGYDFGYVTNSFFGDRLWYDRDGDGVQDSGEAGIGNVTLNLIDAGKNVIDTAVTNRDGFYSLHSGTQTGQLTIRIDPSTLPSGLTQTHDADATCPGANCDGQTQVSIETVGARIDTADFGYQPNGQIAGLIYQDQEPDGVYNNADAPLAGVLVGLFAADGVTPIKESGGDRSIVRTGDEGSYRFSYLPGGSYVLIVDSAGTTLPHGSVNYADPDGPIPRGDSRLSIDLSGDTGISGVNFGYDVPELVEKQVNKSETFPGDTLTYRLDLSYSGHELLSNVLVTDPVPFGTSYVAGSDTPNASVTPSDNSAADDNTVTLISWQLGSNNQPVDGYRPGQNEPNEPALTTRITASPSLVGSDEAITILLTAIADRAVENVAAGRLIANPVNGVTLDTSACSGPILTSADDDIAAENDPVTYSWTCSAKAGTPPDSEVSFVTTASGTAAGSGNRVDWVLASSNSVLVVPTLSFQALVDDPTGTMRIANQGFLSDDNILTVPSPSNVTTTLVRLLTLVIDGRVWQDANRNGIQEDGESGIAGVVVEVASASLPANRRTTTDVDGIYRFANLMAGGSYTVNVVTNSLPNDLEVTYDEDGGTSNPTNGTTLFVADGVEHLTADFGYANSPSTAGLLYILAERVDDNVTRFIWETAAVSNYIGYNLYIEIDGEQFLVNPNLIRANAFESNGIVRYTYEATVAGQVYHIEMIGHEGNTSRHGPFDVGVSYGTPATPPDGSGRKTFLPMILGQ